MYALSILDLDGDRVVSTPAELADAIGRGVDRGNHILIASLDGRYPTLDVMVHDDYAVLHYFETEEVAGHQSVSDDLGHPPIEVVFP